MLGVGWGRCWGWDVAQVLQGQGGQCGQQGDADLWWFYSYFTSWELSEMRDTPRPGVPSPLWGKIQQPAPASPLLGRGVGQAP